MPEKGQNMLEGSVGRWVYRLTLPMLFSVFVVFLFSAADLYFVSLLGTRQLAALSFVLPVGLVLLSLLSGLGVGASALAARLAGRGEVGVLAFNAHALLLAFFFSIPVICAGLLSIPVLFTWLGADNAIQDFIRAYLYVWYPALLPLMLLIMCNSLLRALGDVKLYALLMAAAGLNNLILDPLLIFGIGPFPALGISGAAWASLIAWSLSAAAGLWVLHRRYGVSFQGARRLSALWEDWKKILYLGLPTALSSLLIPLATAVLTAFAARHGTSAVAAFGVGGRMEDLLMVPHGAMAAGLAPFIGQNYGAGQRARIREAVLIAVRFSVYTQLFLYAVLLLFSRHAALLFSNDPEVVSLIQLYLWIAPLGYAALGIVLLFNTVFTNLHQPFYTLALNLCKTFLLTIPLAWLTSHWLGLSGMFWAMAAANWMTLGVGWWLLRRVYRVV